MKVILTIVVAVSSLQLAVADLQNIQNANPLSVDLSQIVNANNGELDDPKFGGYRPLYPPYFLRESTNIGQKSANVPTYFDKEYYTRGTSHDERLDRNLKITETGQQQAVPPVVSIFRSSEFAKAFPNFDHRVKSKFASSSSSSSSHVSSSFSFSSIAFPNT